MQSERDWIVRLTQQIAVFIARALGLAKKHKVDDAEAELSRATSSVLGIELSALLFMDLKSLVSTLGTVERLVVFGQVLEALAEVNQADEAKRRARLLHAAEVYQAAQGLRPKDAELASALARVLRQLS